MKETDENIENQFGNLKKGQPFRVPENYFETFADRLKVRIEEEEQHSKTRSLFFYLKPVLLMAASFVFIMLLIYVPVKKFFPTTGKAYLAQQKLNADSIDSASFVPATLISYYSEEQFLAAFSDMKNLESETFSTENLGDFIAANYSDYDVIANN